MLYIASKVLYDKRNKNPAEELIPSAGFLLSFNEECAKLLIN